MTSLKKLLIVTLSFLILVFLIIIILFLMDVLPETHFMSIIVSGVITSFSAGIGIISIKSGIDRTEKVFLHRVLGGMVIRFIATLILVLLGLLFLELNRISFIFSILFFYFFYLVVEIIYLYILKN